MVLTYGKELANALFHSTCGGRTSFYSDSWSGAAPAYLVSVNDGSGFGVSSLKKGKVLKRFLNSGDGYCNKSKYFRWEKEYTRAQLQAVFMDTVPEFMNDPELKIGRLKDVNVTKYSASGRALEIKIETDSGDYIFEKDSIRWVMGNLKSTLIMIEKNGRGDDTVYKIIGGGWGHGVGLCQMGAMEMAKRNYTYKDILSHYYPGTKLTRLWE
jgi:SpoIID/LytB domain protein